MRTFKFKMYNHKRNRFLKRMINIAAKIWNAAKNIHRVGLELLAQSTALVAQ